MTQPRRAQFRVLSTPKAIAKNVELWISKSDQVEKALNYFTSVKMNAESFLAFATGIFTNEKSDNLSTVSFNRVNDMLTLFQRGKGNHGETLSDAINAFTEYFTHGAGVGNPRNVSENKRLANANFGQGAQWKLEAIRVASNEELLAAAMQRGEMFYTDKLADRLLLRQLRKARPLRVSRPRQLRQRLKVRQLSQRPSKARLRPNRTRPRIRQKPMFPRPDRHAIGRRSKL